MGPADKLRKGNITGQHCDFLFIPRPGVQRLNFNPADFRSLKLRSISDFVLKDGDVVKLDLGVHVDGYIAVVAHTVILSEAKKSRAADALLAAHYCAEAALRLVKPGNEVKLQQYVL